MRPDLGHRHAALAAAIVLVAALVPCSAALRHGFVWDDRLIIADRPAAPFGPAAWEALTTPDVVLRSQPTPYYRPLTRLSLVVDRAVFGLAPWAFHLVNLLLHAAAALAVFQLARRLLGSMGGAATVALLLAVHPVNAECVNLVVARNNLLVALLLAWSGAAYLRGRAAGRRGPVWTAAVLFGLALFAKETAIMLLPFLALAEALLPGWRAEPWRGRALRLAPLAAAIIPYALCRALVLDAATGGGLPRLGSPVEVLTRVVQTVPVELGLVFAPVGLTVFHGPPSAALPGLALIAAWAALGAAAWLALRSGRFASAFGLLWLVVNLVPVSGLVPIPSAAVAERYLYLPAIGVFIVVADQLERAVVRWPGARTPGVAAVAALSLLLAALSAARTADWRDDRALYTAAVRVDATSVDASYDLGVALDVAGDPLSAAVEWRRTLSLDPRHVGALSQLGTQAAAAGALDQALALFLRVLAIDPRDVETRFNVALLLERSGRPAEALAQYRAFLASHPVDYPELAARVRQRVSQLESALASPATGTATPPSR